MQSVLKIYNQELLEQEFSCETVASRQWLEPGSRRFSTVRSRYQEMTSGDCNRLITLMCVCVTVKCKV
jgi:hypothetical protein